MYEQDKSLIVDGSRFAGHRLSGDYIAPTLAALAALAGTIRVCPFVSSPLLLPTDLSVCPYARLCV